MGGGEEQMRRRISGHVGRPGDRQRSAVQGPPLVAWGREDTDGSCGVLEAHRWVWGWDRPVESIPYPSALLTGGWAPFSSGDLEVALEVAHRPDGSPLLCGLVGC